MHNNALLRATCYLFRGNSVTLEVETRICFQAMSNIDLFGLLIVIKGAYLEFEVGVLIIAFEVHAQNYITFAHAQVYSLFITYCSSSTAQSAMHTVQLLATPTNIPVHVQTRV